MNTTFYFIRHSIKFDFNKIETYKTVQSALLQNEKIVLSVEGEKRAEILSRQAELKNIDKVYVSNCVRTLQTAKYLLDAQNLNVNIDERLDERRTGKSNEHVYPNWFQLQYYDENFKTEGGESQKEVRERVGEVFFEILNQNRGKRIAIFAHGYAITFFLMKWMKLVELTEDKNFKFEFNGKIIFDKKVDAPEVFKVIVDDNDNIISIENIEINYKNA